MNRSAGHKLVSFGKGGGKETQGTDERNTRPSLTCWIAYKFGMMGGRGGLTMEKEIMSSKINDSKKKGGRSGNGRQKDPGRGAFSLKNLIGLGGLNDPPLRKKGGLYIRTHKYQGSKRTRNGRGLYVPHSSKNSAW